MGAVYAFVDGKNCPIKGLDQVVDIATYGLYELHKVISDNSQDPRKLWHVLRKTLCRVSDKTSPPHDSDKALADQFASYFHNKI